MRVLLRVAAALLIAIPVLITLVILFALAGRRGAAPSLESERSRSLERGVSGGSAPIHSRKKLLFRSGEKVLFLAADCSAHVGLIPYLAP
jgi:hypothetical protein